MIFFKNIWYQKSMDKDTINAGTVGISTLIVMGN